MPDGQPPRISWWQRRSQLFLVISCPNSGAKPDGEPSYDVVDESSVSFAWGSISFTGEFLKPVNKESAKWERTGPTKQSVLLTVRKATSGPHWRSPFTGGKLPFVTPDWDRWIEEDEEPPEEEEQAAPKEASITEPTLIVDDSVPDLEMAQLSLEGDGQQAWEADWKAMSLPQRMVTMAECWNTLTESTRALSAQQLIRLVEQSVPAAAAQIKGGQSALRSLDTSIYQAEARPKTWIADFGQLEPSAQVTTLSKMFDLLDAQERQMVVAQMM